MVEIIKGSTGNGSGKLDHKERVKFINDSNEVLQRLNAGVSAATQAAGIKAVNLILWQLQQGYEKPIRQTGDLQRDVAYQVVDDNTVRVGNRMEYAIFVHEGTSRMDGRPYIRDAIIARDGAAKIQKVYQKYIKASVENGVTPPVENG